jgi:hypothetical protein
MLKICSWDIALCECCQFFPTISFCKLIHPTHFHPEDGGNMRLRNFSTSTSTQWKYPRTYSTIKSLCKSRNHLFFFCFFFNLEIRGGLIGFWLYEENNKLRGWKNIFTRHIPPWAPHTYDFVVLTSLTHPRKFLFGYAANRKSQRLISTPTYLWYAGRKTVHVIRIQI